MVALKNPKTETHGEWFATQGGYLIKDEEEKKCGKQLWLEASAWTLQSDDLQLFFLLKSNRDEGRDGVGCDKGVSGHGSLQ